MSTSKNANDSNMIAGGYMIHRTLYNRKADLLRDEVSYVVNTDRPHFIQVLEVESNQGPRFRRFFRAIDLRHDNPVNRGIVITVAQAEI